MNKHLKFIFVFLSILGGTLSVSAQDVYIQVPSNNIFNRTEYVTVKNVMNTQGNNSWRVVPGKDPSIRSISGDRFLHTQKPNAFLPSSILHWRLDNINGNTPPFNWGDVWPGYKWSISSYQTWYHPFLSTTKYSAGNIDFKFKIPSSQIAENSFYAGRYKMEIKQNYGQSGWYAIEFSPEQFHVFIEIPEIISWLADLNYKTHNITSLNEFRSGNSQIVIDLGPMEIGHTIDFDLYARTGSNSIVFTSLNGNTRNIDVDLISLGSTNPKITTFPLKRNWTKHSINDFFTVEPGNRSAFDLQLAINREEFKTHFFEAGNYHVSIELDAKGTEQFVSANKVIDFTIVVPALSRISLLGGGGEVNFVFNNPEQYNEGQSKTIPNQLRISNNDNYELYVKSETNQFSSNGIPSDIDASILEVGIEGSAAKVHLSTSSQKIINEGIPGLDQYLNMVYSISPSAAKTLISKEKKSYEINVIYSFTAI